MQMQLCFAVLFVEAQPATGRPCVVESNFDPRQATRQMLACKRECGLEPLQVECDIIGQRPGEGRVRADGP